MAHWYAQLNLSQNFHTSHQWNSLVNGSGDWLDTAVADYSNDTFHTNGKNVVIDTNITCAKLMQDGSSGSIILQSAGLVIRADIEVCTVWSAVIIYEGTDVTIYGDVIANGCQNAAFNLNASNIVLNIHGDLTATGDYATCIRISSDECSLNVFDGTLTVTGEAAYAIYNHAFGSNVYVKNCTLIGGNSYYANAIILDDGYCTIEDSIIIGGTGVFCEAILTRSIIPIVVNGSSMIHSEHSQPVSGTLEYVPDPRNYIEFFSATPAVMVSIPDAANLRKGVVCGNVTGTLAPASSFRRLNRFV